MANEATIKGSVASPVTVFTSWSHMHKTAVDFQASVNGNDDNISGSTWVSGQPVNTRYIHVMPPNTWSCRSGLQIAHVASSHHPGGVNVLFCDGSVKFIKDSISPNIVWAIGSRAQGEVVSADSY